MFKQFLSNADGNQVYLITSLALFLVFFVVVTLLLIRLKKDHIEHMGDLPLNDSIDKPDTLPL